MKIPFTFTFIFISIAFLLSFTQVGVEEKMFPELTGTTLDEKTLTIPKDCAGKFTLIGLAYSNKAEEDLHTWVNPIYNKFISEDGLVDYDINIYFIPMFTGAYQITEENAKKKMKENTQKEFYPYIVCYRGALKKYKEELKLKEKDKPYFFVLDKKGKIIYTTWGEYTDKKMESIEDKLDE